MKQPIWKRWLSYLKEIHIESLESDFNEELHIFFSKGRYQLCTKNAIHSFDDLYVNFDEAFKELNIKGREIEDTLVLGLGLGSIPFLLEKKYGIKSNYAAVEIDETIIYLANKYSLHDLKSPINYICMDAEVFVHVSEEKYDLICLDIFQDDVIPSQFETLGFLEMLNNMLNPKGVLLVNRLATFDTDIEKTTVYNESIFKKVFPKGYHYDIEGNWILVGGGLNDDF